MKKLLLTLGCCVATVVAVAQEHLSATEEDFDVRFTQLSKAFAQTPEDVEVLYNLSQFYFNNANPMRNLPLAMEYIMHGEKRLIWMIENDKNSDLRRLLRNNITINTVRQLKQSIHEAARNTVEARPDMPKEEIDSYLAAFSFDANIVSVLRQQRMDRIYEED